MSEAFGTHRDPGPRAVAETRSGRARSERLERAAQAAQALCEVLWEALYEELGFHPQRDAIPDLTSAATQHTVALAERLADVAATVALLASTDRHAAVPLTPRLADTARAVATAADAAAQAQSRAVLIDERDEHTRQPESPPDREKSSAWTDLIDSALRRFERDRLPFALLLIEVIGVEQSRGGVRLVQLPSLGRQLEDAFGRAREAIGDGSGAVLAPEGATRFWLHVPGMDRLRARALVARVLRGLDCVSPAAGRADAAERYFAALSAHTSSSWPRQNDVGLELALGSAVCPEDGQDVAALVAHANAELAAMRGVRGANGVLAERS